jgi:hypothetical protein
MQAIGALSLAPSEPREAVVQRVVAPVAALTATASLIEAQRYLSGVVDVRDWGQYENDVCRALVDVAQSELVAERARGLNVDGGYIAEVRGSYPDTEIVIRGPGVKSGQPHQWHFSVYDHCAFLPDDVRELASFMWTDMDD